MRVESNGEGARGDEVGEFELREGREELRKRMGRMVSKLGFFIVSPTIDIGEVGEEEREVDSSSNLNDVFIGLKKRSGEKAWFIQRGRGGIRNSQLSLLVIPATIE